MSKCPYCGERLIRPYGNKESNIILIGGIPSKTDREAGLSIIDQSYDVLRREFSNNKIEVKKFYRTYIWKHKPMKPKSAKKDDKAVAAEQNEKCFNHFLKEILEEVKGKDAVLLVGADATKILTDKSVSDWAGILMEDALYLDNPVVMCVPQPTQVFGSTLGEVRLTIRKFSNAIKKRGFIE